jgi:hypothetical protein
MSASALKDVLSGLRGRVTALNESADAIDRGTIGFRVKEYRDKLDASNARRRKDLGIVNKHWDTTAEDYDAMSDYLEALAKHSSDPRIPARSTLPALLSAEMIAEKATDSVGALPRQRGLQKRGLPRNIMASVWVAPLPADGATASSTELVVGTLARVILYPARDIDIEAMRRQILRCYVELCDAADGRVLDTLETTYMHAESTAADSRWFINFHVPVANSIRATWVEPDSETVLESSRAIVRGLAVPLPTALCYVAPPAASVMTFSRYYYKAGQNLLWFAADFDISRPTPLTDVEICSATVSTDGKWFAFLVNEGAAPLQVRIHCINVFSHDVDGGNKPVHEFPLETAPTTRLKFSSNVGTDMTLPPLLLIIHTAAATQVYDITNKRAHTLTATEPDDAASDGNLTLTLNRDLTGAHLKLYHTIDGTAVIDDASFGFAHRALLRDANAVFVLQKDKFCCYNSTNNYDLRHTLLSVSIATVERPTMRIRTEKLFNFHVAAASTFQVVGSADAKHFIIQASQGSIITNYTTAEQQDDGTWKFLPLLTIKWTRAKAMFCAAAPFITIVNENDIVILSAPRLLH